MGDADVTSGVIERATASAEGAGVRSAMLADAALRLHLQAADPASAEALAIERHEVEPGVYESWPMVSAEAFGRMRGVAA